MMTRRTPTRAVRALGTMALMALATCLWLPTSATADETPAAADLGPAVGAPAPDFTLYDTDAQTHTLSAHREERPVVMVFFRGAW